MTLLCIFLQKAFFFFELSACTQSLFFWVHKNSIYQPTLTWKGRELRSVFDDCRPCAHFSPPFSWHPKAPFLSGDNSVVLSQETMLKCTHSYYIYYTSHTHNNKDLRTLHYYFYFLLINRLLHYRRKEWEREKKQVWIRNASLKIYGILFFAFLDHQFFFSLSHKYVNWEEGSGSEKWKTARLFWKLRKKIYMWNCTSNAQMAL